MLLRLNSLLEIALRFTNKLIRAAITVATFPLFQL
jgi:hypothetical protein